MQQLEHCRHSGKGQGGTEREGREGGREGGRERGTGRDREGQGGTGKEEGGRREGGRLREEAQPHVFNMHKLTRTRDTSQCTRGTVRTHFIHLLVVGWGSPLFMSPTSP